MPGLPDIRLSGAMPLMVNDWRLQQLIAGEEIPVMMPDPPDPEPSDDEDADERAASEQAQQDAARQREEEGGYQ